MVVVPQQANHGVKETFILLFCKIISRDKIRRTEQPNLEDECR